MGVNGFLQFFRDKGAKLGSGVFAGLQGQQNAHTLSFIRQMEKEMRSKNDLSTPLRELEFIVFDLETTGFFPDKGDKVLSIGAVKMIGKEILEQESFYTLLRCETELPHEITELTGLTSSELAVAPEPRDALVKFLEFASSRPLVAHHSRHEQLFMQKITWDLLRTRFHHRIMDTSFLTRIFGPQSGSMPLEDLCGSCGIPLGQRHHALGDALMTAKVWSYYLAKAEDAGYRTLQDIYSELGKQR